MMGWSSDRVGEETDRSTDRQTDRQTEAQEGAGEEDSCERRADMLGVLFVFL
jgi:hypothetical protein